MPIKDSRFYRSRVPKRFRLLDATGIPLTLESDFGQVLTWAWQHVANGHTKVLIEHTGHGLIHERIEMRNGKAERFTGGRVESPKV